MIDDAKLVHAVTDVLFALAYAETSDTDRLFLYPMGTPLGLVSDVGKERLFRLFKEAPLEEGDTVSIMRSDGSGQDIYVVSVANLVP